MKARWAALVARYAAYSARERALLVVAAIALLIYVGDALWLAPIYSRAKNLARQTAQQEKEFAALQQQMFALQTEATLDKNSANRDALSGIEAELAQLDQQLAGSQQTLVSPEKMQAVLGRLLQGRPGVHLLSLKTLPVVPLDAAGKPVAKVAELDKTDEHRVETLLYRHSFELTLEGPYLELVGWLSELEAGTQQLLWQRAHLEAGPAQLSRLVLSFYTLSLDASWIAL